MPTTQALETRTADRVALQETALRCARMSEAFERLAVLMAEAGEHLELVAERVTVRPPPLA